MYLTMTKELSHKQQKIKDTRAAWSMTRDEFAVYIGKSLRSVQDYEWGVTEVPDTTDKLLDLLIAQRKGATANV